jgi:CRP-like cAMP-binding protein
MIKEHFKAISQCSLFKNIEDSEVESICESIQMKKNTYQKHDIIVDEGDHCNELNIILKGKVELHTFFISGDVASLITLTESDIFGEAILFSNKSDYPISATALSDVTLLRLRKSDILHIMEEHPVFLENYLGLLSRKLLFLNDKFKLLSLSTIRGKIAHVLIKLSKEQESETVKLPFSKEKMALHICTRRPSLSRELAKMQKDGLIQYDKSIVKILDYDALVDELF